MLKVLEILCVTLLTFEYALQSYAQIPGVEVVQNQPFTLTRKHIEAISLVITIQPGDEGILPHHHPGPSVGYIMEGELLFQVDGGPIKILKQGAAFVEGDGQVHVWAGNGSNSTVCKIIVTLLGRPGKPLLTFENNYPRDTYEVALKKAERT